MKKEKKPETFSSFKQKIISALRQLSYSHPSRKQAEAKSKREPATFECALCSCYVYTGSKELHEIEQTKGILYKKGKIKRDHIEPIVPPEGFKRGSWDWHEYIERMFCGVNGYQILCEDCHDVKTQQENKQRKEQRALTKKLNKVKLDLNKEIL